VLRFWLPVLVRSAQLDKLSVRGGRGRFYRGVGIRFGRGNRLGSCAGLGNMPFDLGIGGTDFFKSSVNAI